MTIIGTVIQDLGLHRRRGRDGLGSPPGARRRRSSGCGRANAVQAIGGRHRRLRRVLVVALLWALLVDTSQKQDILDQLGANRSDAYLAASAMVVCVFAPIAEEIFFRGFFFTALRNAGCRRCSAAISRPGVLFGLVHVIGTPFPLIVPLARPRLRALPALPAHGLAAAVHGAARAQQRDRLRRSRLRWPLAATLALVIAAPTLVVSIGLLAARSKRLAPPVPRPPDEAARCCPPRRWSPLLAVPAAAARPDADADADPRRPPRRRRRARAGRQGRDAPAGSARCCATAPAASAHGPLVPRAAARSRPYVAGQKVRVRRAAATAR